MRKGLFDEYFNFSAFERRSIIIVSFLLLIVILVSFIIRYVPGKQNKFSKEHLHEIYDLAAKLSEDGETEKIAERTFNLKNKILFSFDPNTASKEKLEELGFSVQQINTIKNYLTSGGRFYQKKDFKKIYNLTEEQYLMYEPYINIQSPEQFTDNKPDEGISRELKFSSKPVEKEIAKIELNSAEPYNLMMIKGIGEIYANRIFKYRELLGGFCKKEQLLEVYGINDTLFQQILPKVIIDTTLITAIDLKKASYKELIKHPYLDAYSTKAILNYRKFKKQGLIKSDLLVDKILSKEVYGKIAPYIR